MPEQQYFPNPPGATPTGAYEYILVPLRPGGVPGGIRPDQFIPFFKLDTFFIESEFGQQSAPADRKDLINGSRVYRMLLRYIWRFPHDNVGPFITTPQCKFRFVVDDPSIGTFAIDEWTPCSL